MFEGHCVYAIFVVKLRIIEALEWNPGAETLAARFNISISSLD